MALKVLVVGTGHSGTRWATDVLAAAGLKAGHEQLFKLEPITGEFDKWDADASCRAAPWLNSTLIPRECRVVHLIRDPLMVWRSMFYCLSQNGWAFRSRKWVEEKLGVEMPEGLEDFLSAFIVLWTELIKGTGRVDMTARLEDGQDWAEKLGYRPLLHVKHRVDYRRAPESSPPVTWAHMAKGHWTDRLRRLAEDQGYGNIKAADHQGLRSQEDQGTCLG